MPAASPEPLLQQPPHVAVREVPERPEDALLERPGVRPVAQHRRVVVRLDEDGVAAAKRLDEARGSGGRGPSRGRRRRRPSTPRTRAARRRRGHRRPPARVSRRIVRVSPGVDRHAGRQLRLRRSRPRRRCPRVPRERHAPLRARSAAAPRAWSPCSCETKTASSEAGSTPADCSRSASCRGPSPASSSTRAPPPSTSVALPSLPDPRTPEAQAHTDELALARPPAAEVAEDARGEPAGEHPAATRRTSSALTASMPPRISSSGNCRPK